MNWLTFVAGAVVSWGVPARCCTRDRSSLKPDARAALRRRRVFSDRRAGAVAALIAQGQDSRFQLVGHDRGDRRRRARRARRGLHHLFLPHRRDADLRDAACLRRRAARERSVAMYPPTEGRAQSAALRRIPHHCSRRRNGAVFQTAGVRSRDADYAICSRDADLFTERGLRGFPIVKIRLIRLV